MNRKIVDIRQNQADHRSIEKKLRRAEFLFEVARLMSSCTPLSVTVGKTVELSKNVLGEIACLMFLDGESGELRLEQTASGSSDDLLQSMISVINAQPREFQTGLRKLVEEGNSIFIPDVSKADPAGELVELARQLHFASIIVTPVRAEGKAFGLFISASLTPDQLDASDSALAQEFAQAIASGLQKARILSELEQKANTDALTGLYNVRFFYDVLTREMGRIQRHEVPLSLLMLDIDNFKRLNDTYGHLAGNDALRRLSAILLEAVRMTDFVFRCSGDEFAIVLPETDLDGALHVAEHIRSRVEAEFLPGKGRTGIVTVSIGVAEHEPGIELESLIGRADQALYEAKRSAKNEVHAYGYPSETVSRLGGLAAM